MKHFPFTITSGTQLSLLLVFGCLANFNLFGQGPNWELEKMPEALETDFALSSLPLHLRSDASIYLLDPKKGYYLSRKGSNGFICFVDRTEWDRKEYRNDIASPISYDAEGARVIFPVYMDVAAMRASGKYTIERIRDSVDARIKKGVYKAPRPGIAYMLGPLMRTYNDAGTKVITINVPHYMFYAPYLTAADFGCRKNAGDGEPIVLGDGKSPHGYAIIFVGEKEKAKIMEDQKELLKRLGEYKPYFQTRQM
jgi:hypothetical protein